MHSQKTEMDVDNVHMKHAPTIVLIAETTSILSIPASTVQAF
jgi:hypothetical protein